MGRTNWKELLEPCVNILCLRYAILYRIFRSYVSWWLHRAATVMWHAKCCVQSDTKPFVLVYFISYYWLLLEWCNYHCHMLTFTSDWFWSYLVLVRHCIIAQLHMWANSKLIKLDLSQEMDKMNVRFSLQVPCLKDVFFNNQLDALNF